MSKWRALSLAVASLGFANSWPCAAAQSSAAQACDAQAANPSDPSRPDSVPGVAFDKIKAPQAETACRKALEEDASPRIAYQLGRALEAGHNSEEAVRFYRLAADQGYAPAQTNLAQIFEHGNGVTKSDADARHFYQLAAGQGYAPAQFGLALLYDRSPGGYRSDKEIARLLQLAADQGFVPAEGALGLMFEKGRGIEQSLPQAIVWYQRAARAGNVAAQDQLKRLRQPW